MRTAATLLLATLPLLAQTGCNTSCGQRQAPLLWSEGVVSASAGVRTYETTKLDGTWLHFPSYRRFELPHGFGTKDLTIDAYVSLGNDTPVTGDAGSTKFAIASSGEVLAEIPDNNTVIVENTTCENEYFVFVRITDKGTATADASR